MGVQQKSQVPELGDSGSWRETARREAESMRVWTGMSGLTLSGEELSNHLVRALNALDGVWDNRAIETSVLGALSLTSRGGWGYLDSQKASEDLLGIVLAARLNVSHVDYRSWEGHPDRTWAEVRHLLTDTAQFARECGPQDSGVG